MNTLARFTASLALAGLMCATPASGAAGDPAAPPAASTIAPGTRITMQNWRRYASFMPDGMVALFEGKYFWKMPQDVAIDVGPTVIHPLPKSYLEATEKYASQVQLETLPDGGFTVANYRGGEPFPNPAAPHRGWKILANFWYRYIPHLVVNSQDNLGFFCTEDSYGSINCIKSLWVYRQLSFNTDPGVPATIPGGEDKFFTMWAMVYEPEQEKYSANLTIGFTDLTRPQEIYAFRPALRRYEPVASAARCASNGSDATPDDGRFGFNGNIPLFQAKLLGERRVLTLMDFGTAGGNFPANYAMPLGWPKPSWGKWEVRDAWVIDVRRLPAQARGYCYGKRVMYIDKQFHGLLWEDLYDAQMRPWKFVFDQPIVIEVPGAGPQNSSGAHISHIWDIQNNHATFSGPADGHGYDILINSEVPKQWRSIAKYTTPGGLGSIMR
jgi:hypothetical protein